MPKEKRLEIISLAAIIIVRIAFITYIFVLDQPLSPRGDALFQSYLIVASKKFNLLGKEYNYPVLYCWFWSIPLFTPLIPDIYAFNAYITLIIYINHILATLLYYILIKEFTKDYKIAITATVFWQYVSGFTWLYSLIESPEKCGGLYAFIIRASYKVGYFSGGHTSQTFLDCYTLVRLAAFNTVLASILTLNKYCTKRRKKYFLLYTFCYILSLGGHLVEGTIIAIATLAYIVVFKVSQLKKLLFAGLLGGTIASIFYILTSPAYFTFPRILALLTACFSLPLTIIVAPILLKILDVLTKKVEKYSSTLQKLALASLTVYYGLSLIAFLIALEKNIPLKSPLVTHWYIPPVEWGFKGIFAIISLAFITKYKWYNKGLKYAITYLLFLYALIILINIININLFFVTLLIYFDPLYALPFIAMIDAYVVKLWKKGKSGRLILSIIIVTAVALGVIDNLLSAYYWRHTTGFYWQQVKWSREDLELMNFLYKAKAVHGYIATAQPHVAPSSYIVWLGGFTLPPRPILELYLRACNYRELLFLNRIYPVDYIVVDNTYKFPKTITLLHLLKTLKPVYSNNKYKVYLLKENASTQLNSKKFICVRKIIINGTAVITQDNKTITISGEYIVLPLNNGYVKLLDLKTNIRTLNNTFYRPTIFFKGYIHLVEMYSLKYFKEIGGIDSKLTIKGEGSFKIVNTFCSKHIYIKEFTYTGKYNTTDSHKTIREIILEYLKSHNIQLSEVIQTPLGVTWIAFNLIVLDMLLLQKWKLPRLTVIVEKYK